MGVNIQRYFLKKKQFECHEIHDKDRCHTSQHIFLVVNKFSNGYVFDHVSFKENDTVWALIKGMCRSNVFLLVLMVGVVKCKPNQEFLDHPISKNHVIGNKFVFRCISIHADTIQFMVDNVTADSMTVKEKGFQESPVTTIGDSQMKTRELFGIARKEHNATSITCAIRQFGRKWVNYSQIATYNVQGERSPKIESCRSFT